MATNDYRSYVRATEEYRRSDTLQHAGKKGMKWGISTTPGYKAIGQKAKGLLDRFGNYIYDTAKKVGDTVSDAYSKLTSKSTPAPASKVANRASDARDEAFKERQQRLVAENAAKEARDEILKEMKDRHTFKSVKPAPKLVAEPNKEPIPELQNDEHGKYKIVDGEKHYVLDDGKEYRYTDGKFFEVGGDKVVDDPKVKPKTTTPSEGREPSEDMVDDDGNMKDIDEHGAYYDAGDGVKYYDLGDGKRYFYSDGLYFPVDGDGDALALVWNPDTFRYEPADDVRHSETSPHYIGEILFDDGDFLEHYGILGMKWGVRRYQNEDGTLTPEGRERYARNAIEYDKTEGKLYKKVKKNKDIKAFNEQYKKDHPELQKAIKDADEYSKSRLEYLDAVLTQPGNRFILDLPPEQQRFYLEMALDIWKDTSPDAKKFEGLYERYNKEMRAYEKAAHKYVDDLLGEYKDLASENPNRISVDIETGKSKATSIGDELVVEMIRSMDKEAWKGRINHSDIDSDQNELYHDGRGHLDGGHSGRYPWGSGEDPYQRSELEGVKDRVDAILVAAPSVDDFLNNGILDPETVARNTKKPIEATGVKRALIGFGGAVDVLNAPDVETAATSAASTVKIMSTRNWTEHDFDGIPTEAIKKSNARSEEIKKYKGFHGNEAPVESGKRKVIDTLADIASIAALFKLLNKE